MAKPLIVGIDIGTTTGLSIIDLRKNIVFMKSKRNLSVSDIKKQIMNFGKPIIVATDKRKIPAKIRKIASSFNSRIFNPKHDLSITEKNKIIKRTIKNPHERDSLAAAFYAFKYHEKKFKHIEKVLQSKNLREYEDVVKEMLLQKETRNLAETIEMLKPSEDIPVIKLTKEINLDWKDQAERRERDLKDEKKRNEIMRIYCDKLEEKIKALERQKQSYLEEQIQKNERVRKAIIKEKEIQARDILISQLKFEISKKKELLKLYEEKIKIEQEEKSIIMDKLVPVVIIPEFSKEEIMSADRKFNINNKVVFFENIKFSKRACKELEKTTPKVVIINNGKEIFHQLRNSRIIVIEPIEMERKEFFGAASPKNIEEVMRKTEKKKFINWLEEYRKR